MNKELIRYAKEYIKENLRQFSEKEQALFKRVYSNNDHNKSIDEIVETMPDYQLDRAMGSIVNAIDDFKPLIFIG